MKNNYFTEEAVELCEAILQTTRPTEEWGVVNIIKSVKSLNDDRAFNSISHPEIPMGYYYVYDEVPQFLLDEGVFCGLDTDGAWYLKQGYYVFNGSGDEDWQFERESVSEGLTLMATKKGWINKTVDKKKINNLELWGIPDLGIQVFVNSFTQETYEDMNLGMVTHIVSKGPSGRHHLIALFDRKRMQSFVNLYKGNAPVFDEKSGMLLFLGKDMKFTGQQAQLVKVLVENINSTVSYKDIFEIISGKNYEKELARNEGKVPSIHNPIKNDFKNARKKIYKKDSGLCESLVLVERNGIGMFVNQANPKSD
ncbi:MAG: hypothetical protein ABFQ62_05080 [Patescibacteria group bacterium]